VGAPLTVTRKWYVIHTQTGYEDKVKANLESRLEGSTFKEVISQILIPTERVSEIKDGKKRISLRKFFQEVSSPCDRPHAAQISQMSARG